MQRMAICLLTGVIAACQAPEALHAGVPVEKIAEYVQQQIEPLMDAIIDRSGSSAAERQDMHKRMVLNVHRYAAAVDEMTDKDIDPDLAVWIEHSLMAKMIHDGGEMWSPSLAGEIDGMARDLTGRFRGLTNARCRQMMRERHELMESAAAFRNSLLKYIVVRMGSMPVVRVKLGGGVSEFKNAILEARGESSKMFLDPAKLAGPDRVILNCRDNPVDSRIMTLAVARECGAAVRENDALDWLVFYPITSPAYAPDKYAVLTHPRTFVDVLPQIEKMWRIFAVKDADGSWSVNAAAWRYFIISATLLRYPSLPARASLPAASAHPLFVLFNNDPDSWRLLLGLRPYVDSDASGGGVTDTPTGPVVTASLPPLPIAVQTPSGKPTGREPMPPLPRAAPVPGRPGKARGVQQRP